MNGGDGKGRLAFEESWPGEEDRCVHRTQHKVSPLKGEIEKQGNSGEGHLIQPRSEGITSFRGCYV